MQEIAARITPKDTFNACTAVRSPHHRRTRNRFGETDLGSERLRRPLQVLAGLGRRLSRPLPDAAGHSPRHTPRRTAPRSVAARSRQLPDSRRFTELRPRQARCGTVRALSGHRDCCVPQPEVNAETRLDGDRAGGRSPYPPSGPQAATCPADGVRWRADAVVARAGRRTRRHQRWRRRRRNGGSPSTARRWPSSARTRRAATLRPAGRSSRPSRRNLRPMWPAAATWSSATVWSTAWRWSATARRTSRACSFAKRPGPRSTAPTPARWLGTR